MKLIEQNTYDFPEIRAKNVIYVDKTAYLHRLVTAENQKLNFISRPRRFGKSLMISTLKAIFQGRCELFKDLAIDKTDYDWQVYPVIHFDMSGVSTEDFGTFEKSFREIVSRALASSGATVNETATVGTMLGDAITELAQKTGKGVVILVDEYDAPVGHSLDDIDMAQKVRTALSALYIQIKRNVKDVRFLMMTGVSKFTQLSVFSALNNLRDVTFDGTYAAMLGYTEEELDEYFSEHMHKHAEAMGKSDEDYRAELKFWCNGYRFSSDDPVRVYNPVAIGKTLSMRLPYFKKSWASTGRASSLMNHLKKNELAELDYENLENIKESAFDVCGLEDISTIGLLYQSGYLTIKDYNPYRRNYTLGVPNQEIREDLTNLIVYSQKGEKAGTSIVGDISNGLFDGDYERVEDALKAYYAGLTYGSREKVGEASYQRVLHTLLAAGGFDVTSEEQQAVGRADIIAKHVLGVFVFELKVDESADAALAQIEERGYCLPYLNSQLSTLNTQYAPVFAIGINFNSQTKNIDGFKVVKQEI